VLLSLFSILPLYFSLIGQINFILYNDINLSLDLYLLRKEFLDLNLEIDLMLKIYNPESNLKNDSPFQAQLLFQDAASPVMEGLTRLHNVIMGVMAFIGYVISDFILVNIRFHVASVNKRNFGVDHNTVLEVIWTFTPALILIFIAIPSFGLLYAIDEIMGHQWYWSYELAGTPVNKENLSSLNKPVAYSDEYDANLINETDLILGEKRLLQSDNAIILPLETQIRFVLTSSDVIHSWAVPSLGLKLDAVPGRLSQIATLAERPGNFYGQCSEICGVNHSAMPIELIAL